MERFITWKKGLRLHYVIKALHFHKKQFNSVTVVNKLIHWLQDNLTDGDLLVPRHVTSSDAISRAAYILYIG